MDDSLKLFVPVGEPKREWARGEYRAGTNRDVFVVGGGHTDTAHQPYVSIPLRDAPPEVRAWVESLQPKKRYVVETSGAGQWHEVWDTHKPEAYRVAAAWLTGAYPPGVAEQRAREECDKLNATG